MIKERPLSHWIAVARMGFERDFHRIFSGLDISRSELARRLESSPAYVSKVLNGKAGNFTLGTMAKLARAIGAAVQISLTRDGKETVRVVDYETAATLDGIAREPEPMVVDINVYKRQLALGASADALDSNRGEERAANG